MNNQIKRATWSARWACCCTLTIVISLVGCDRVDAPDATPMTAEQVIVKQRDAPMGESIKLVSEALAKQSVFVGIDEGGTAQPGTLRFKTGADNQGRLWVYAYTSKSEFSKAFSQGGGFAEMSFPDLFEMIEPDDRFMGIFLNSASEETSYPIPREVFADVKGVLRKYQEDT